MTKEEKVLKYIGDLVKGTEFEGNTFLVGGAVRDEIMGKSVKDLDIVVSMPDGGVKFAEWATKQTKTFKQDTNPLVYPRFGTAKFNLRGIKIDGEDISDVDVEVVMTRGEAYEKGSRHPTVVYADIVADANRRDLTINALYKDVTTGKVVDPTGRGLNDIKNGVIRTPLDPAATFQDDPLRMLRVIRFAVRYNWKLPRYLLNALSENVDMLKIISQERIRDELNKILVTDYPDVGIKLLSKLGLSKYVIPELDTCMGVKQNEHHNHDVYEHILEAVKNTPPILHARLAALLHDIGKPTTKSVGDDDRVHFYGHEDIGSQMAKTIMTRLKYSGDETETVSKIVKHHMDLKQAGKDGKKASDKQLRKFMVRMGDDLGVALEVMHADNIAHKSTSAQPDQIPAIKKRIETLSGTDTPAKPNLPINGNDIMVALGIKPGPDVKKALTIVLDAWFENPGITKDEALRLIADKFGAKPVSAKINDVGTKKKKLGSLLMRKIVNPDTGNSILVKSALQYSKAHPARVAAMNLLKQHGSN